LLMRLRKFPYDEINSAADQIVSRYSPQQYSFLALGASPKIIKWILKKKGYNVAAIGVSKVKGGVLPTEEFIKYVDGKLQKITNNNIVIMDFVEKGESLVQIKKVVSGLWKRGAVVAVALGTGAEYNAQGPYAASIDFIVQNIPDLTVVFEKNIFKETFGRAKHMRDYTTFPSLVPKGEVKPYQQQKFAIAKSSFARAAELGPLNLDLATFIEIAKTETSDSDDAVDEVEELVW